MRKPILNSKNSINAAYIILFILSSISTYYGIRVLFPVIQNIFRGTLILLPAFMIYSIPLFLLILFYIYSHTGSVSSRWRMLHLAGVILTLFGLLTFFLINILVPIYFDGKYIFGGASPIYPLDIFIFSIISMIFGLSLLIMAFFNREERRSQDILFRSSKIRNKVKMSFYLPFASYFFGLFIFGLHYFFEPMVYDSNWVFILFTYLAFPLPTLLLVFNRIYELKEDKSISVRLNYLSIIFAISLGVGLLIIISFLINPLYVAQSMAGEFFIDLIFKWPVGLLIIALLVLIPGLFAIFKTYKDIKKNKVNHEQK